MYNVPGNKADKFYEATGECGNTTQFINIEWKDDVNQTNGLKLTFGLNETANEFELKEGVFTLSNNVLPGSQNSTKLYIVGSTFVAPKDKSYHCTRVEKLNLTDTVVTNTTEPVGTVSVSHVLVEAFHTGDKQDFSSSVDCDAINTPGKRNVENLMINFSTI